MRAAIKRGCAQRHGHTGRGFTLIELMIVVAIIGILSAVAYPAYIENVKRGRRADAQTKLLEAAQWMQRFYAANNTYEGASLPEGLNRSPTQGTKLYGLSVSSGTRTAYTLSADPDSEASMKDDACGAYTYTHLGARGVTVPSGSSKTMAECWR